MFSRSKETCTTVKIVHFEILCDQILFGNALDRILEEEEDNEKERDTQRQRQNDTKSSADTFTISGVSTNKENEGPEYPTKIEKNQFNMSYKPSENMSGLSSFPIFEKENTLSSSYLEEQKPKRAALSDITNSFNKMNKQEGMRIEKKIQREQLQKKMTARHHSNLFSTKNFV